MFIYNSQSTAIINETCSVGKPTVESTISIVTKAALGTLATPIDVAVEAKLIYIYFYFYFYSILF